jgi:glucose/arabinose dehydrogenase
MLAGGILAPVAMAQRAPQIKLPPGFKIQKVMGGLTYPSSLTFDGRGRMYVAEAGGAFLEKPPPSRILEVTNGRKRVVADLAATGVKDSVVGLTFHDGSFFITHRAQDRTGAVSRVSLDGSRTQILSGILDSQAEHQVNDVKVGPDGRMYLASGPATNSGVMGIDNAPNVERSPLVHTTHAATWFSPA